MSSRDLGKLHKNLQPLAAAMVNQCREAGIDLLIYCTYRSNEEQARLYAIGRTVPGRKVTWLKAGESMHNVTFQGFPASRAFDCVPLIDGRPLWETTGEAAAIWEKVGSIGESLGLEWGGRWSPSRRDFPHFQLNFPK